MDPRWVVVLLLLPSAAAAWPDPADDAVYRIQGSGTEFDPIHEGGDILEFDARVVEDALRVSVRLEMPLPGACPSGNESHVEDALRLEYAFGHQSAYVTWWTTCPVTGTVDSYWYWRLAFSGPRQYPPMHVARTENGTWHTWDLPLAWHAEPGKRLEFGDWVVVRERRDGVGVQVDEASRHGPQLTAVAPAPAESLRAHRWTDPAGDAQFRLLAGPAALPAPAPDQLRDILALDVRIIDEALRVAVLLDGPTGCGRDAKYVEEALTVWYRYPYRLEHKTDCIMRQSESTWRGTLGKYWPAVVMNTTTDGTWHVWDLPLRWHGLRGQALALKEWGVEVDQTYAWITSLGGGGEYTVHQTDEATWRNATITAEMPRQLPPLSEPAWDDENLTAEAAAAPRFKLPWPQDAPRQVLSPAWITAAAIALLLALRPRLLGFVPPLFTRISEDRLLDHPRRRRIQEIVRTRPGITFRELREELGTGPGGLLHHVRLLERTQLIRRISMAGRTHYFWRDAQATPSDVAVGTRKRILAIIEQDPGLDQTGIARRLGVSRENAGQHVRAMVADGLLKAVAQGRHKRYHPVAAGPSWKPGGSC